MAKTFMYRGKTLEELQEMSLQEFAELLPANLRRSVKRGLSHSQLALYKKVTEGKNKLRTHERQMVVVPQMVGKKVSVHTGKIFADIYVTEEMLGHRLGEFALTRKRVGHNAPGIGATKSTTSVSVR